MGYEAEIISVNQSRGLRSDSISPGRSSSCVGARGAGSSRHPEHVRDHRAEKMTSHEAT